MDTCELYLANEKHKEQYFEFLAECIQDIKDRGFEFFIPISDKGTFEQDIKKLSDFHEGKSLPEGWVPASVYWLIRESDKKIIGVITVRHRLAGYLYFRGGHISYYIRPSERRKGYATKMLSLSLKKCMDLNIDKVMITCAKNNIGSARTIQKNGGVLHSEDVEDEEVFQRYWIYMPSQP